MKRTVQCALWCMVIGAQLPVTIRAQESVAVQPKDDHSATRATEELLQRPISIELDRVSLKEAIDSVAAVGGILVQYRLASVSGYSAKVSVHADKTPLGIVFAHVLQGTDLQLIAHRNAAFVVAPARGAAAEQGSGVSGVVTSARTGQPLQGAAVAMDDGNPHQLTDAKGHFAFSGISGGSHRVAVRMIGYARQMRTVTVSNDQPLTLSFALDASTNMLDQVVVTATGAQRYRELGHVVTQLNADSLVKSAPIRTLSDLLISRVPGLAVMNGNGGVAGGEVALRLRAQTSVSLDPQPIIIVDGVRYHSNNTVTTFYSSGSVLEDARPFNAEERSPLNDLNVNDIESVEVVKGPSASTLYGPDAANGVIVIKTKHGEAGKAKWNVYLHPDLATITKTASHRPSTGFWAWGHDASGVTTPYSCTLNYQYYKYCVLDSITQRPVAEQLSNLDILTKNRPAWQGGANVSGGSDAFRYFFSLGYDWQEGSIAMSPIAKQAVIAWLGPDALTGKLRDPNTQQMTSVRSNLSSDLNPKLTVSFDAGFTQTDQRAISLSDVAGNLASAGVTAPGCSETDNSNRCTYIDWIGVFMNSTERTGTRFTGTVTPVFRPWDWVTLTGAMGADIDHSIDRGIHPNGGSYDGDQGSIQDNRRDNTNYTGSLTAVARNRLGRYTFQTSVGTQYTKTQLDGVNMSGYGLAPGSSSITTALSYNTSQLWQESATLGTYGEEVLGLNDRIFLTGSLRLDGSTSFGDAYKPRPYPKVGLSWILSDEPFMRSLPFVSELRARASFGAASRYPTSPMKLGQITPYQQTIDGSTHNLFFRSFLGNPLLSPERTHETEYGLDATLFDRKLDAELTGWTRRTNAQIGLLFSPQGLPPTWGNIGDVSGHGFELRLHSKLLETRSTQLDLTVSATYQTSKLLSLGNATPSCGGYDCYRVGYPLGSLFSQTLTVLDTIGGHADGIVLYPEIVRGPSQYVGPASPPYDYTFSPTASFLNGRVRVSTIVDRATGFYFPDGLLYGSGFTDAYMRAGSSLVNQARYLLQCCSFEPGDFTRWRELSVTTDLPPRLMHAVLLSHGTISVQFRNLAQWTRYKLGDPESVPGMGITGYGSASEIPSVAQPRSFSLNFNLVP